MTPGMLKMYISFVGIGSMFFSVLLIYLSRYKLRRGFLSIFSAIIAYILLILAGIIILFVVLSGPVTE